MSHRASLDVSAPVLRAVTGWITRHRRRPGSRPAQRAGTVHTQVVLVLRWLRHRLDLRTLAVEAGISIATGYRYLHEALDVIAAHAPDLGRGSPFASPHLEWRPDDHGRQLKPVLWILYATAPVPEGGF